MADGAPSLESLLLDIKKRGMRLNNLFQRDDWQWQANVRSADNHDFYEFGYGVDAAAALEAALAKGVASRKVDVQQVSDEARPLVPPAATPDDEDLIG